MLDAGNIPHFLPCNQPTTDARECVCPHKREKCFFWFETEEIQFSKQTAASFEFPAFSALSVKSLLNKNRTTLVWKGLLNMITFQKWQKKNSPFLTPFLCLHKYKHFTNQYITERKLVQENTCLFPYWHLFSIFPNRSTLGRSFTLQAGLVLLFEIFWRHKRISNRFTCKKSLQNSNRKN